MKKILAVILAALMLLSFAACNNAAAPSEGEESTPVTDESTPVSTDKVYKVGVCQLVQHVALDAATQGFCDALKEKLGEDKVEINVQNASNDVPTCGTICNQFVADGVDLIMANATPALQAAAAATNTIPIVGTSITDYATALAADNWTGASGTNITGTADLAPLKEQAAMINELFPDAENIGILYCSGEANSVYQADVVEAELTALGKTCKRYTFADSNEVANITSSACSESDVIYIPTDNTAANCTEVIKNVVVPAGIPVVAGEEGICSGCGVATLSIDYYDIGYVAGEMAAEILAEGKNPGEMEIRFAPKVTKKYNKEICEALGITVSDEYTAIE